MAAGVSGERQGHVLQERRCAVCNDETYDITLKCGHVFHKLCAESCFQQKGICPHRANEADEDFNAQHQMEVNSRCVIKAVIYSNKDEKRVDHYHNACWLTNLYASIFLKRESIEHQCVLQYITENEEEGKRANGMRPFAKKIVVNGHSFLSGHSLADYGVKPGEKIHLQIYLP